jgi:hypothetical protein
VLQGKNGLGVYFSAAGAAMINTLVIYSVIYRIRAAATSRPGLLRSPFQAMTA